ncbi:MAG: cupin domain-containing protein [Burkholderiales bacterium]
MLGPHRIVRHEFPWGEIEWLAGAEVGNSAELALARLRVAPGRGGETHVHRNCEESIYVVAGEVECAIGDRHVRLSPGACAVVPRGVAHAIRGVGASPAELLLGYSSSARDYALA